MRNLAFVLFAHLVILGDTSATNAQTRQLATEPVGASWVGSEASAQLAVEGVRFVPPPNYYDWTCKVAPKSGHAPYFACWAIDPNKTATIFITASANEVPVAQHAMLATIKATRNPLVSIGAERVGGWAVTHYTLGTGYNPHRISIGIRQTGAKNWLFMVYNTSGYPADIRGEARRIFSLAR